MWLCAAVNVLLFSDNAFAWPSTCFEKQTKTLHSRLNLCRRNRRNGTVRFVEPVLRKIQYRTTNGRTTNRTFGGRTETKINQWIRRTARPGRVTVEQSSAKKTFNSNDRRRSGIVKTNYYMYSLSLNNKHGVAWVYYFPPFSWARPSVRKRDRRTWTTRAPAENSEKLNFSIIYFAAKRTRGNVCQHTIATLRIFPKTIGTLILNGTYSVLITTGNTVTAAGRFSFFVIYARNFCRNSLFPFPPSPPFSSFGPLTRTRSSSI